MRWLSSAGCVAALLVATNAPAAYPERPLRYIVPQTPGSASDVSARVSAFGLTRIRGQQVVVDNRSGGGLTIGIDLVVRAAPDGYTVGYGNIGGLAVNRSILPKVPYDSTKDVQPIALNNSGSQILAVGPAVPVKSVRELIDYAQANPGKLRGLAVTGPKRSKTFPELPTVDESGVPDYFMTTWSGLITPVGVPKHVITTLNEAVNKAMTAPTLLERYAANGVDPGSGTGRGVPRSDQARSGEVRDDREDAEGEGGLSGPDGRFSTMMHTS